jgi:hypothetical protein
VKTNTKLFLLVVFAVTILIAFFCVYYYSLPSSSTSLPQILPTEQSIYREYQLIINNQQEEVIGKVGDTLIQGNYLVALVSVEKNKCFGEYSCSGDGRILVAVEIIVKSVGEGVHVNPFYCKIKDSQGYEYLVSLMGKEPSLKSQNDLPFREISRGWITFELPENATGLIFSYEPFNNDTRIRFYLGI